MTETMVNVIIFRIFMTVAEWDGLMHGSPTLPDYIMWPMATFVNYVYTVKITQ
jgi:flavorubredoxin